MSRTPINIALDRAGFRCLRCDAPMGGCDCWEQVKLHCPDCGRTQKATREPSDLPGAKVIELRCPKCWQ